VEDRKHSFIVKSGSGEESGQAKFSVYEWTSDSVIRTPGPYFRWPLPIQSVTQYDNRLQITTTTGEETPTRDGKPIIITTAIGWRIADPYWFSIKCNDMDTAQERLRIRVRSDQKTVIGEYDFANFVSDDPEELKYDQIEYQIAMKVAENARELYGIEVEYVRLEKLALPSQITEQVFDAMKKEREAEATRIESEGKSQATQIKATAEGIADTILGFARRTAAEIEAKGIEQAATYNETFRQDEGLALFLLAIENLPKILEERTTLVFDQNSPLVSLLMEMGGDQAPVDITTGQTEPMDETPILDEKK
jgi:membrane protease subunit HflC